MQMEIYWQVPPSHPQPLVLSWSLLAAAVSQALCECLVEDPFLPGCAVVSGN